MAESARIDTLAVFQRHPFAKHLVERLDDAGHEAVLIGGVVRDGLLSQMGDDVPFPPEDVDIATSAVPNEVRRVFADCPIVGVGEEFGVLVVVAPDGRAYEVATFRVEQEYDGRWPSKVTLVRTLSEDVLRRDLTINGLAARPDGTVIDLVNGIPDLHARKIRSIGDPEARFAEDYLRMLRAVRFVCQIGGTLDRETERAIAGNAFRILDISKERIGDELIRMLRTPRSAEGLLWMDRLGLLEAVLPELDATHGVPQPEEYHPEGDVFVHTVEALRVADGFVCDPIVKLATVLHDIGKPAALIRSGGVNMGGHCAIGSRMTKAVGQRLRLSRHQIARLVYLVKHHMRIADFPRMGRGKQVRFLSEGEVPDGTGLRGRFPLFFDLLQLLVADCQASAHRASGWMPIFAETLRVAEHIDRVCDLARARQMIDGHVLIELGLRPGPDLGRILTAIHDRILSGEIVSRGDAVLEAQSMIEALGRGK